MTNVENSLDRYADIIMECSNIHGGLIKLEKEMSFMAVAKLTKEDQQLFKDTLFETRIVVQQVLSNVASRNYHKEKEDDCFFQKQKVRLQKINYELVHRLWDIRAKVLE